MTDVVVQGTFSAWLVEGVRARRKKSLQVRLYRSKLTYVVLSKKGKDKDKLSLPVTIPLFLVKVSVHRKLAFCPHVNLPRPCRHSDIRETRLRNLVQCYKRIA